jgi:hypothetical protein
MNTFKRSNSVVVVRNKQSEQQPQQQPQQTKLAPLRAFQRLKRVFSSSSSTASAKNSTNNSNCNSVASSNNNNNSVCNSPQQHYHHHTRVGSSHSRSSSVSSHVSVASSADETCTNYSVSRPSSPADFESDNEYLIYHNSTATFTSNTQNQNNQNSQNKMLPPLAYAHRPSSTSRMRPPMVTVNKPVAHPMAMHAANMQLNANKQQPVIGLPPNRSQTPTLVSNAKRPVVARTVSEVPSVPAAVVAAPAPMSAASTAFTPDSNETMMSSSCSSTSTTSASLSLLFPPSGYDFSIAQIQDAIETIAAEIIDMVPRLKTTDPGYNEFGRDPSFVARSFAEGFITRSRTSPLCVLVGFFYLKQLLSRHPKLKISSNNASRLVLVACAAGAKFVDDVSMRYTNEHWIRIGGGGWLSLQKFNSMEREFMGLMEWNLSIKPVAFQQFCAQYGLGVCIPNQGLPWSQPSSSPVLSR